MTTLDNIGMISINPGRRTSGAIYERLHPKATSNDSTTANEKGTSTKSVIKSSGDKARNVRTAPIMQMVFGMITITAGLLNFAGQLSPFFIL